MYAVLGGTAQEWWSLIETEEEAFESFRVKFGNRFWNETIRRKISSFLEFGFHDIRRETTMVEHAIKVISEAKNLIPPPPESDVVIQFSRNFTEEVRNAIWMREVTTYSDLLEVLQTFDRVGGLNRTKYYARRTSKSTDPTYD